MPVILLGIPTRGVTLAHRLAAAMAAVEGTHIPVGALDVTMYRDDLRRQPTRAVGHTDVPRRSTTAWWCWSTTSSTPGVRCVRPWTPWATSAGRGRSGWPSWSTAGTASCRSGPTTSARTFPTRTGERVQVRLEELDGFSEVTIVPVDPHGEALMHHLLSAADLDLDQIAAILDLAEEMAQVQSRPVKKLPALRGRTVVNLFFEDSTRTRSSFELAGKWLSADVINISAKGSSVSRASRCGTPC